ncbi:putative activator of 90kDa heat shock protein ATPase [Helianthus annuus]|uniref:Activator of 90kDa heat shock protein ATPase n=1 Tax=Helianthus annuus TaxID=4232 RepID=A0A9K3MZ95_HELAN|nr:activator of 90 kDa heat shock protein ATPase homolog 2 [Helianthus annuus]KAF5781234.1 putative activator of 90kDa heat shock protein ATPase [Helianthus annuus]KAJ0508511.1 putative activator of 90kDa heat shock protein ATPase [Helianthus annuus]KAJ0516763.1 putative activator of 90kDa heat shock protein ATPase [Helianthus annuus]KAJ0684765.1 putative activator of 90kDa heat shock protein ATPase [Helianthus annuus]
MAKYGEGDKRWLVEDIPNGANVHNWHLTETDCLEWSKNLLTKLIVDQTILAGEGNFFNQSDPDDKSLLIVDGIVEIPYISDENADEDPDLRVIVKDEGPIGKRLKDAFLAKGKEFVLKQIRVYVEAMVVVVVVMLVVVAVVVVVVFLLIL